MTTTDAQLTHLSQNPLVSIIMPSYNREDYIEETLLSILKQDYRNVEIVIADGGSTDRTLNIIRHYEKTERISWISEVDHGRLNAATNKALKMSQGEIIGLHSTDDIYLPGAIRSAVEAFMSDPLLTFVGGETVMIDGCGLSSGSRILFPPNEPYYTIEDIVSIKDWPHWTATFLRRDRALAIGGMNEDLQSCGTFFILHYLLESAKRGERALRIPKLWSAYREHPNQQNRRPDFKGLPMCRERHLICKQMAEKYKTLLTRDQINLLFRSTYFFEAHRRFVVHKQMLRLAFPLMMTLRFGGTWKEFKTFFMFVFRRILSKLGKAKRISPKESGIDMRWYLQTTSSHYHV